MIKNKSVTKKTLLVLNFILTMFLFNSQKVLGYGFGFSRNDNHTTPNIGFYKEILDGTDSYYVKETQNKELYLTFDAGYDNGVLSKILDVLNEKNVKATFFVTGDFLIREEELTKRIALEGHIVGNHTWTHKNITKLSFLELKSEIEKVENAYQNLTGKTMMKFFRPPEGEFDRKSLENVQKLGYSTFFWSIAYRDWDTKGKKGGDYGYNQIMPQLHSGAILLLHTVSEDNLEALPRVIDDARSQGYVFKNLDEFKKDETNQDFILFLLHKKIYCDILYI